MKEEHRVSILNQSEAGTIAPACGLKKNQKLSRALTCMVRAGTVTPVMLEEPVEIAPLNAVQPAGGVPVPDVGHCVRVLAGNPKLG